MSSQQPLLEPATRPRPGRLLGDVLVSLGFCDRPTVEDIVLQARAAGRPMGQLLLEQGLIDSGQLAIAIAERFGLQSATLATLEPDAAATALVSPAALRRLEAVPVGFRDGETLLVAMANPSNVLAVDDLAMLTDLRVEPVVVTPEDLAVLLGRLGRPAEQQSAPATATATPHGDDPTASLLRSIVAQAIERRATDVHIDPDGADLLVRHRVDGLMVAAERIPGRHAARLLSQIKILSDLDVAERRLPQDGRVSVAIDGHRLDLRVSTMTLVDGESAVLQLLDPARRTLSLAELGMGDSERMTVEHALAGSRGAIVVAGPAGSGLTSTLHAALAIAACSAKTAMTIEDPVEYRLPGIKQMQVRERAGLDFATGLRAIVGADPDVILAGELRDAACARIAIDAALTGKLVLCALHAAAAPAAAARLADMGVEPYLVASGLQCVVAQRLARRLCECCRREAEPVGCDLCAQSGYRGRIGLFEVMPVSEAIGALIVARAPIAEIRRSAIAEGMRTLADDGLAKVRAGATTLAEVTRVTA